MSTKFSNDPNEKTRVIDLGGGNYGTLYPDVYFRFVSELYNKHDDLVRGMELAQVKLADGSALDYLNLMLGTEVTKDTPMELGYATLLDALAMRVVTKHSEIAIAKISEAFRDHQLFTQKIDGPLFPEVPDQ